MKSQKIPSRSMGPPCGHATLEFPRLSDPISVILGWTPFGRVKEKEG